MGQFTKKDFENIALMFPSYKGFPVKMERHEDFMRGCTHYGVRLGDWVSFQFQIDFYNEDIGAVLQGVQQALDNCYHEGAKYGLSRKATAQGAGGSTQASSTAGGNAGTNATHWQGQCVNCGSANTINNATGFCRACSNFINQSGGLTEETKPVSLQCEATVLGELKGYRFWNYDEKTGLLSSLSADHRWMPGGVEYGDTKSVREHCGLYSYKDFNTAMKQAESLNYLSLVVGTVDLWGDVIEHEKGYRSEYAKIVSIAHAYGTAKNCVKEIRQLYGCT